MACRLAPTQLHKHIANLLKGGLLKEPPIWFPVVHAFPPGPSIIHSQIPNPNLSGQDPIELEVLAALRPARTRTAVRHQHKHLRTRPPRPRAIVYPEDRLRRQFYRDHPFELQRPRIMVENDEGFNRTDFSKLLLDEMDPSMVTGETVIKHQLYLMINEGKTEREAYALATADFYRVRQLEELHERAVRDEIVKHLGPDYAKVNSWRAIELEEKAIKDGEERL
ncbi:mitochondrial ribosomal protein S25 [Endogone sp. FLAS-F59071]|nr:mitochondrial ribosomal protein S25 [Endogone sp. FLAS-F59071]|eukprot:RUS17062.1 mitochondrial ribosomal protein S25 [Endogone sp. FLAS-F59071]